MKTITKFKANDGSEWNTEEDALRRDEMIAKVDAVMAPLGTTPKAVSDGEGWLQHNPDTVLKCKQGILDICRPMYSDSTGICPVCKAEIELDSSRNLKLHEGKNGGWCFPNLQRPVNPYTLSEERTWQRIVGSASITLEHIAAFERETGKKFDHNYLY